ncbi:CRISPR-associated protein Cmr3 [Hahella sp. CCB-MM4]|uniref:type III-B CRISPR module-associated Cmr3 family protein n=1 Tax=Hahella sp. (strain CCB-MM4) TaxID=1926491 RepID=UPI000B9C4438|nr:type III-B CRISPR module-associated Cmr3 family protein [Hahella sp. CCB-MM4]OZG70348.1 CRISPR-associated protein Cmr3 [Hahella sp. CCB-MM4]
MNRDTQQTYLIEPTAPLIIRTGRPFDELSGTDPARFPPPSTLAGALRTAHARCMGKALNPELAKLAVAGPLAVMTDLDGNPHRVLVPQPSDAHYYHDGHQRQLVRAAPRALASGEGCDLPEGLWPLQLEQQFPGKVSPGPDWWAIEDLLAWRRNDRSLSFGQVEQNGWMPPPDDIRTHVAINRQTQASEAGKIFQTAGLSMWQSPHSPQCLPQFAVGLLGRIEGNIEPGVLNLGGERRLAKVKPWQNIWPGIPSALVSDIQQAGALTLTLLTPALFSAGWIPGWLDRDSLQGIPPGCSRLRLKLRAAAVKRWHPHSGWDLAANRPRASRKMVPAGATYWFDIQDDHADDIERLWLNHLSDENQDRLDGFGLALPFPYVRAMS